MPTRIKIAVSGIAGRMGQRVACEILNRAEELELVAGFARKSSAYVGRDIGKVIGIDPIGLSVSDGDDGGLNGADLLIDFTHPTALKKHLDWCLNEKAGLVLGTTGFTPKDLECLQDAKKEIPILYSANTSIGVALVTKIVKGIAAQLDDSFDIEIIETHHRNKKDAPSGTAIMLAEAAAAGRDTEISNHSADQRYSKAAARETGSIGLQSLRGGDVIGDHTVMFLGNSERIEITHKATNRGLFAKGAIRAAIWLKKQPAGLYSIQDLIK